VTVVLLFHSVDVLAGLRTELLPAHTAELAGLLHAALSPWPALIVCACVVATAAVRTASV
jgi:hypothetical protein